MPTIKTHVLIHSDIDTCFDLARSVEAHTETTAHTQERAVEGVTSGLLEIGDTVTWEAVHFGIKQRLTAKVTEMERPFQFTDVMVKGAFHSFVHVHEFHEYNEGTVMIDTFSYISPFGIFGRLADFLFLRVYMERFITKRSLALKKMAEGRT